MLGAARSRGKRGSQDSSWWTWGLVTLVVAAVPVVSLATGVGAQQQPGTITGRVSVDEIPDVRLTKVDTDQAVCGVEVQDRATLVDPSGGVAYAVVIVKGAVWRADPLAAVVSNRDCYFEPRVQVARTGSVVTVTSEDESLHTTHAYDDRARTMFNIAIPTPGLEIQRPLRRPGVVRLECDSHGWMRGWVYVTDDMGAVTGLNGRFEIAEVPPGTYELEIWHERYGGMSQWVTVTEGRTVDANFSLR